MSQEKTVCNRENESMSDLWGRNCWVADSLASLISSHVETLGEKYGEKLGVLNDPDSPFWQMIKDLEYFCEELRVQNGMRPAWMLNRDEAFPSEITIVT